jgi:hypothetical protein
MAGGCHPSTLGDSDVYRIACGVAFLLIVCSSVRAQDPAIDDLKGKIFDARMAQQTLGDGLKYCPELNGKSLLLPGAQSHPRSGGILSLAREPREGADL